MGSTIAFLKPDVDSIGAAAVLVLRAIGMPMPARPPACEDALRAGHEAPHSIAATDCDCAGQGQCRSPIYWGIERIATADAFSPGADWTPRPLPTVESPWPTGAAPVEETRDLAALGVLCSPTREQAQHPLALRVAVVAAWMAHEYDMRHADRPAPPHVVRSLASIADACGVDASVIGPAYASAARAAHDARMATALAVESGEAAPRLVHERVALVDYGSRGALGLGYCLAPVVVATGLPVEGGGRKYTIAAWSPRYVDFPGLLAELNRAEVYVGTPDTDRWGGNLTSGIIGSPQGHGSRLSPETILGMLVTKHIRW